MKELCARQTKIYKQFEGEPFSQTKKNLLSISSNPRQLHCPFTACTEGYDCVTRRIPIQLIFKLLSATDSAAHVQHAASISFSPPHYYAFGGSDFNGAETAIGGPITLINMRSCDLLNFKVHLNPPANYGMFCGGISISAAEMGLSK